MKKIKKGMGVLYGYRVPLVIALLLLIFVGYFLNVIFFKNKEEILSVVILDSITDTSEFENELAQILPTKKNQKISVKVLNAEVEANQAILITWMRAKTIDVIVGQEGTVEPYAQHGFIESADNLAYADYIQGLQMENLVVGIPVNAPNKENAEKVVKTFVD